MLSYLLPQNLLSAKLKDSLSTSSRDDFSPSDGDKNVLMNHFGWSHLTNLYCSNIDFSRAHMALWENISVANNTHFSFIRDIRAKKTKKTVIWHCRVEWEWNHARKRESKLQTYNFNHSSLSSHLRSSAHHHRLHQANQSFSQEF